MKQKHARTLRDAWGERPCPHPAFSREYDQAGKRTGDYFCTQCGAHIPFRERAERLAQSGGSGQLPGRPGRVRRRDGGL